MLLAVLLATLTGLVGIGLALGRLHLLSAELARLGDSKERDFLRRQVESLQEQVLALTAPAAQARLHSQRGHPQGEQEPPRGLGRGPSAVLTLLPQRSPLVMHIPPELASADAFDRLGDEGEEAQ